MAAPMTVCRKFSTVCCRNFSRLSSFRSSANIQTVDVNNTDERHKGVSAGINIGFPFVIKSYKRDRAAEIKRNQTNSELERAARHRQLKVPLDDVKLKWERSSGPHHIRRVADHYAIYRDLFDSATFLPQTMMRIGYNGTDEDVNPVYMGNFLTPTEASCRPSVLTYECPEDSLWTLILTNPDGHLLDNNMEYIHWMIGNIPGNQVCQGDEVFDYLAPFPARGTGYHRFIFVLFRQDGRVNYDSLKRNQPCHNLRERTFETLEFYRRQQDHITPSGLAFFQCRWDPSVREMFHTTFDMREPVFEYDHPKLYIAPQRKYPHKKPLQYLLKYMAQEDQDSIKGFRPNFPNKRLSDWQINSKYLTK